MSAAWRASISRDPDARAWISDMLRAGHALGFYIAESGGSARDLSHVVERHRGRYLVFGEGDRLLGCYATQARAIAEGFAASLARLQHGMT